jgi:hypothetical protein
MNRPRILTRRLLAPAAATVGAVTVAAGVVIAVGLTSASGAEHSFSFKLKPSAGITACLPHAAGKVTITPGKLNDTMKVSISGMPAKASFDLFVIQLPTKPFGVSWYQTDVDANSHGTGTATVRGVFDAETFSVSPGGTTTFGPTHQFHLGLWFNNPNTPFRLGCEPGATSPTITPFNGKQHAGIQVLNTAQFPANKGPLSHVHR